MQYCSAFCVLINQDLSILAENLKFIRKRADLTQTNFGEQFGLNRGNIDSYEKGTEPRLKVLIQIAKTYKVNLTLLLTSKMTQENFHLFSEDAGAHSVAEDPSDMYGDSEIYTMLRDMEESDSIDDRRGYTREIMKKVSRLMNENSSLRKELMEELKKNRG